MKNEENLQGLNGWLIMVGLGIVISPLKIISFYLIDYLKIFSDGTWFALTTPGAESYHHLWAPLILGEMAVNGGLVLGWGCIAFLFFSKKKIFPKCYIGILLFTLVFILADALVVKVIRPDRPFFDVETMQTFAHALLAVLIWVPYMLISVRVKATFVK